MKTYLECIPCFIEQALRVGKILSTDEVVIKEILDQACNIAKNISLDLTPPEIAVHFYSEIRKNTGIIDPYRQIKKDSISQALALYPKLKKIVEKSEDRILTAIRISIAGNVIDFGINNKFNLNKEIEETLEKDFAICDYAQFIERLDYSKSIVYLGDNAGESVFDRILIEELGKPIIYVVREIPILNDVTVEDAIASGLDKVAEIISSGSIAPATLLNKCSPDFLKIYKAADMIISKGQGNYEGLSDCQEPIFFLLKAKCSVIARELKVNINDIILKNGNYFNN